MSDLIGKKFPVLNDGFVTLIDHMGSDQAIVDAARISYGKGTRKTSEDRDLLRYLMRKHHSTPFEMAEIKIHIRIPMDAWRQMIRHRTANVNEYSTRYSEAIDSRQTTAPDEWRLQATTNKQGSSGFLGGWSGYGGHPEDRNDSPEYPLNHRARFLNRVPDSASLSPGAALTIIEEDFHRKAQFVYEERIKMGVAREQARKDLPLSTYTEAIWKCDLRNVLGFLSLRMDSHAQLEIRQYADIIGREIVAKLFPMTWEAFLDYTLGSMTLSTLDIKAIAMIQLGGGREAALHLYFANAREKAECEAKLDRLGIV